MTFDWNEFFLKHFGPDLNSFIEDIYVSARNTVVSFLRDMYTHAESVVILVFASLGVNAYLSELPYFFTLPIWIEAQMVVPVIAVIIILTLLLIAAWRRKRRNAIAV